MLPLEQWQRRRDVRLIPEIDDEDFRLLGARLGKGREFRALHRVGLHPEVAQHLFKLPVEFRLKFGAYLSFHGFFRGWNCLFE
jgi:hypothetical protein